MHTSTKLLFVLCLSGFSFLFAQNQYVIPKINGRIILDGLGNEAAWEGIKPLPVVQHKPYFGSEPTERTEILIAYDKEFLYVAGRLYDSEPHKIASSSKKRDSTNPNCQWFGIALDTFNDNENALAFFTTPSGLRWDAAIINDTNGDINFETSWNTFWDVEVVRNGEGWFAEFRIPFSSLRFQDVNGRVVMGLISWRSIPRKSERDIFPAIPPNWGGGSFYKISEAQEIVFEQVHSYNPLYVAPYVLGGHDHTAELNEAEDSYQKRDKTEFGAGLDLKYGITNNLTLDATLNPDFAQVEADDQQINLTRFSMFFPEKRLFFQERSSLFDFNFESSELNRLFHSRRIGIHNGKPVPIYGGARLVGRVGLWDLGFLNMQSAPVEDLTSENFGVLRLRRQVFNPYSYIGAISTTRIGTDGKYNIAYGFDGMFRLFDQEYFIVKWAQTFEDQSKNNPLSFDPARIRILLQRRNNKGLGYGLAYSYAGKDYNPGVGFEIRENYTRYSGGIWHGWFPDKKSWLYRHQPWLSGILILRNKDGTVESAVFNPGWLFETKSGYAFRIKPSFFYEDILEAFSISENTEMPKGNYHFANISASFSTPFGQIISTETSFSAGSYYDGRRISFEISPVWNASSSLELSGIYQYNHINFPDRNRQFFGHIIRLRALYMMNTKFSVTSFVQYNNSIEALSLNIRARFNPREGIDLYLVYNETVNTDRHSELPVPPFNKDRTILLKYTYTFNL
ncbi:MAG: carbohydrate binding family 9 domain-containing protein [Calditrichales bacterium]|nr:carbohydrate binding family 9 domain-containing protein [Calditrichales bacterium]